MLKRLLQLGLLLSCVSAMAQVTISPGGQVVIGPSQGIGLGGDIGGSTTLPQVTGLRGQPLPVLAPGYPHWNGTAWVFDTPASVFTAATDLAGTPSSQTVIGILGKPLPTLAAGYPHWNGTAWVFDTPSGTFVAGTDLSGTSSAQTVIGLKGQLLPGLASGYLHWNGSAFVFDSPTGSFAPGTDLSGNQTSQQVIGILGHALPGLSTGFVQWNGSAWVFAGSPLPTANQGNGLVNSSSGSGTTYVPLLYEIHSSGFPSGTTLAAMLKNCPVFPTPCRVILDPTPPGTVIPVGANSTVGNPTTGDYPVIIGAGSTTATAAHVEVFNNGATLQCTLTGLTLPIWIDCLEIGQWGQLAGINPGNTTNGGAVITTAANATYRSVVANAGVQAATGTVNTSGTAVTLASGTNFTTGTQWNNTPITINGVNYIVASVSSTSSLTLTTSAGTQTGVAYLGGAVGWQNYLQQRFEFEGNQIVPSGTSIITSGLLTLTAVEGQANIRKFAMLGINNTANIMLQDGPVSGDNNSLKFDDGANVCGNHAGCVPLWITTAQNNGNGINIIFHNIGFGNGPGGSGCASGSGAMLCIDGSYGGLHNSAFINDILFDGGYVEMSGTYPAWSANGDVPGATLYNLGNAILPPTSGHNNPSGHYFVVTTAGTPGVSEPVWNSICSPSYTQGATCVDGSVVWTDNGTVNPSHFAEFKNARDLDIRGFDINAGTTGTCVLVSGSTTGRIHIGGRVPSTHCTSAILTNSVTGYSTNTGPVDLDYLYPGANGLAVVDGHLAVAGINQPQANAFAGSCTMSTTTCTFSLSYTPPTTYLCFTSLDHASAPPATAISSKCSFSGTTVTITAGSSNTLTWDAMIVGNPN